MYPLILKAPLKDYIWGGNRLKNDFGFESELEKVAEAWVLSCHEDGKSVVINGELSGKTLNEALDIWGDAALGSNVKSGGGFPILVKLIDAKDRLSVQVHPNDEYALKNEGDNGKTEMWYVVDCDEGSRLVYGLKSSVTKEDFRKRIENNTLDDILNYVDVRKGDRFFITSGTVHAIGKGILIAEIQENSNVTYRVSDYGRLGADGKPRALHIDKAIEVSSLEPSSEPYGRSDDVSIEDNVKITSLASCKYFDAKAVEICDNSSLFDVYNVDSFVSCVILSGKAEMIYGDNSEILRTGSSVFIPAGIKASIKGKCEFLMSSI